MARHSGHSALVHFGRACLAAILLVVAGCTGDDGAGSSGPDTKPLDTRASVAPASSPASATSTLAEATTTTVETTTTFTLASAEYCALAVKAVEGRFDFTDPERVKELTEAPELTARQVELMRAGAADAVNEVADGNGWSNDELVSAVNEVCGLSLAPATLIP